MFKKLIAAVLVLLTYTVALANDQNGNKVYWHSSNLSNIELKISYAEGHRPDANGEYVVYFDKQFDIKEGTWITIRNETNGPVYLRAESSTPLGCMFWNYGTLNIIGNGANAPVIIDGGSGAWWDSSRQDVRKYDRPTVYNGGTGNYHRINYRTGGEPLRHNNQRRSFKWAAIQNNGTLNLTDVVFRNMLLAELYDTDVYNDGCTAGQWDGSEVGVIKNAAIPRKTASGPMNLTRVIFERCESPNGVCIFTCKWHSYQDKSDGSEGSNGKWKGTKFPAGSNPNTPESVAITLRDCTFRNNMAWHGGGNDQEGWGGLIRFRGASVPNLNMYNCTFDNNRAYECGGGAVWWNAGGDGTQSPRMRVENCTFTNNIADDNAGALRIEMNTDFSGNNVFRNNKAGKHGGAINIIDYQAAAENVNKAEATFNFPSGTVFENNHANASGGAIAMNINGLTINNKIQSGGLSGAWFTCNLNGASFSGNSAGRYGGALYFDVNDDLTSVITPANKWYLTVNMNSGTVDSNTSQSNGGGVYIRNYSVGYSQGGGLTISNNTANTGYGGGIFAQNANLTLNSLTVSGNKTVSNGPTILLDGALNTYYDNNSTQYADGGGLAVLNSTFTSNGSTFRDNTAFGYGGAIFAANCNGVTFNGDNLITNNTGGMGGGILNRNSVMVMNQGTITNNTARLNGGGIAQDDSNASFTMNGGEISDNNATDFGGGIFSYSSITLGGGNILRNTAGQGGGGLRCEGSSLTIRGNININENKATNGAGFYVRRTALSLSGGTVAHNIASNIGGGFIINNNNDDNYSVTVNNINVHDNKAVTGAGASIENKVTVYLNGVTLENNEASGNGGGIFATGSDGSHCPSIIYQSGTIHNNLCTGTASGGSTVTSYLKDAYSHERTPDVTGFGGGIFVNRNARFTFQCNQGSDGKYSIGIYGNKAANGGDDVVSTADNTFVNLPATDNMLLAGFPASTKVYWVEDYNNSDPSYTSWTTAHANRGRFRSLAISDQPWYFGNGSQNIEYWNKHINATLGWSLGSIKIRKYGLADRDNAIFNIYQENWNGSASSYKPLKFTVVLTKADERTENGETFREKEVVVDDGWMWSVEEDTRWSWAYRTDAQDNSFNWIDNRTGIWRNIDASVSDEYRIYRFRNIPNTGVTNHDEDVQTNDMQK